MTESSGSNALKHGAFSEVLILPGEDPAAFEQLKQRLFAEYNVSGCSEELTMTSIAKTIWQLQRLGVYEHVQFLRAQGSSSPYPAMEKPNRTHQQVPGQTGLLGLHPLKPPLRKLRLRKKPPTNFCSSLVTSSASAIWTKNWT